MRYMIGQLREKFSLEKLEEMKSLQVAEFFKIDPENQNQRQRLARALQIAKMRHPDNETKNNTGLNETDQE